MEAWVKWALIAAGLYVAYAWWSTHQVLVSAPATGGINLGGATTPPVVTNPDQVVTPSNTVGQDIAASGEAVSSILGSLGLGN